MTQVHDFSLSLICLSMAVAAEAAGESKSTQHPATPAVKSVEAESSAK